MERATAFTAVPGWGNVMVGAVALVAAMIAQAQPTNTRWHTELTSIRCIECVLLSCAANHPAAPDVRP